MKNRKPPERAKSSPPDSMITEGPLLCLDIDGVCAPLGKDYRFDFENPPPGFLERMVTQWHPAMKDWFEQLDKAYRQVTWISSWNTMCAGFAQDVEYAPGQDWSSLFPPPGYSKERRKIYCCMKWIDEKVPLAIVDDHFCISKEEELDQLYSRSGPTLVISPDRVIGLGQALVDLLVEFANDPWQPQFAPRHPRVMYLDRRLKWEDGSIPDPQGWPTARGGLRRMWPCEAKYFESGNVELSLLDQEEHVYLNLTGYSYKRHYRLIVATQITRAWYESGQKPFPDSRLDEFLIEGLREETKKYLQYYGFLIREGEYWQPVNAQCARYVLDHAHKSYETFCTDLNQALDDSWGENCATMVAARVFQAWEDNGRKPLVNSQIRAALEQIDSRVDELFEPLYASKFMTGENDNWQPACIELGRYLVDYVKRRTDAEKPPEDSLPDE